MKAMRCHVSIFNSTLNNSLTIIFFFLIALHKGLFEYKYAIGRGGFGKVWRVSSTRLKGETTT